MNNPTLRTFSVTQFTYRGIGVKINHPHDHYKWAYYVYLVLNQFQDQKLAKKLWIKANTNGFWDYYKIPFLSGMDGHGGITYYEKSLSRHDKKIIEIGFDYGHIYDDEETYELQDIVNDAINTVDWIHNNTTYLCFCFGNGKLYLEKDGEYTGNYFYSLEYKNRKNEVNA